MKVRDFILALILTVCAVLSYQSWKETQAVNKKVNSVETAIESIDVQPAVDVKFTDEMLIYMYNLAIEHKSQQDYIKWWRETFEKDYDFTGHQERYMKKVGE